MTIKKGDRFKVVKSGKVYEVAGRWGGDYILSQVEANDEQCMVYTAGEVQEFFEEGSFIREERCSK